MRWNAKTIGLVLISLAGCIVFNAAAWLSWHSSFILNDGIQYLSTAGNWLAGRGFSTDALLYTPHFQGVLPAPQTVWPPGYPLVVALTSQLGLSLESASLMLNLVSLAASAWLVFLILKRFNCRFSVSVFCALTFYCTAIPWSYSLALISEPLFSLLILAAIYFQPSDIQGKIWPWVVSGIFIALSILMRYSGVLVAVGVGLGVFVFLVKNYRHEPTLFWRGIALLTLQISISVIVFATMLYRTFLLTGTTSRNIGVVETEADWVARLKITVWQFSEFFGFTDGGVLPSYLSFTFFGAFLLLLLTVAAIIAFVAPKVAGRAPPLNRLDNEVMRYVIVGHSVVFAVFFSLHIVGWSVVELNHRYLYQVYPGLFALFCALVMSALTKAKWLKLTGLRNWFRRALGALFCLFVVAQINNATALNYYARPGIQAQEVVALSVSEAMDLQTFIQSCFVRSGSTVGSIWSNDGQQLYKVTGVPTITVADVYGNKPYDMEIVRKHVADYDIKMFIILNNLPDIAPEYTEMLSNVKQWLVSNEYAKVPMLENQITSGISVDAYVVDQACGS